MDDAKALGRWVHAVITYIVRDLSLIPSSGESGFSMKAIHNGLNDLYRFACLLASYLDIPVDSFVTEPHGNVKLASVVCRYQTYPFGRFPNVRIVCGWMPLAFLSSK